MSGPSFSDLTSTLKTTLATLPPPDQIQESDRNELLSALTQLQQALDSPIGFIQRLCFSHYPLAIVRTAIGMGVFDAFVETGGKEVTIKELEERTKGDVELLKRVVRFLCAHGLCKETTPETYQPLPLAMMFGKGSVPSGMIKHFHTCARASVRIHEFFEKNNYTNRLDAYNAPFQLAYNTTDHYFEWLAKNPEIQEAFNAVMTGAQQHRGGEWFESFPVVEKLSLDSSDSDPDRVLFVDVGGGVGHELINLRKAFPSSVLPGKLILQDLPHVVASIKDPLPDDATASGHNIFEPQPVKGAKTYYLRTVLHDFPDKQALTALEHIRDAMAPDSVLLINEHLVPDGANVPPMAAIMDFHMTETVGSLERTTKQWLELLGKVGFVNVEVYKGGSESFPMALFEARL